MFQHILVPMDLSKRNKHALEIAVNLAHAQKGNIHLLHVIEIINDTSFEEFKDFYMRLEDRAQSFMDSLMEEYHTSGVEMHRRIVYGVRAHEILSFAVEHHMDLIVMNSHKIDLQAPAAGWGTISYKVGILSQCPVMLVK